MKMCSLMSKIKLEILDEFTSSTRFPIPGLDARNDPSPSFCTEPSRWARHFSHSRAKSYRLGIVNAGIRTQTV